MTKLFNLHQAYGKHTYTKLGVIVVEGWDYRLSYCHCGLFTINDDHCPCNLCAKLSERADVVTDSLRKTSSKQVLKAWLAYCKHVRAHGPPRQMGD